MRECNLVAFSQAIHSVVFTHCVWACVCVCVSIYANDKFIQISNDRHTHISFNFCTNIHILWSYWSVVFSSLSVGFCWLWISFPYAVASQFGAVFGYASATPLRKWFRTLRIQCWQQSDTRKPTSSQMVGCVLYRRWLCFISARRKFERTISAGLWTSQFLSEKYTIAQSPQHEQKTIDVISIILTSISHFRVLIWWMGQLIEIVKILMNTTPGTKNSLLTRTQARSQQISGVPRFA